LAAAKILKGADTNWSVGPDAEACAFSLVGGFDRQLKPRGDSDMLLLLSPGAPLVHCWHAVVRYVSQLTLCLSKKGNATLLGTELRQRTPRD
jgi:hypothetical protein